MKKHLIMYWRIRDIWSPTNLVASCVAKLDDTLLLMDVIRDSVGPPTECTLRHSCGRQH
jgi:hypothetical protein